MIPDEEILTILEKKEKRRFFISYSPGQKKKDIYLPCLFSFLGIWLIHCNT